MAQQRCCVDYVLLEAMDADEDRQLKLQDSPQEFSSLIAKADDELRAQRVKRHASSAWLLLACERRDGDRDGLGRPETHDTTAVDARACRPRAT